MAILEISTTTVAENSTGEIATLSCDGATSYKLIADVSVLDLLEMVGDKLVVKAGAVLDYEAQSTLHFEIQALDSGDEVIASQIFTEESPFSISNVNDNAPTDIMLNGAVSLDLPESTQAPSFIGVLTATDADGDEIVDYALDGVNDFFEIENDGGTWRVKLKQGVDYETVAQQKHTLRITATDSGGLSKEQEITINVTNVNDNAPTAVTLSSTAISENAKAGDIVGELSATDADGDPIVGYSLTEPSDFFEIDLANGKWVVRLKAGVDYENVAQREHEIHVVASDGVHTSSAQTLTITVTNENDNAPAGIRLDGEVSVEISESTSASLPIGTLSASDADGNPITRYDLVGENEYFEVVESDGGWVVRLKKGVDYEAVSQRHHELTITAFDGVNRSQAQVITINVTNVNDTAPTDIELSNASISESAQIGDEVGILSAIDADGDSITKYELAEENDFFAIVEENGVWKVVLKKGVDYENVLQREHTLKIIAKDGTLTSDVQDVTIRVNNANEAPTDILVTGGSITDDAILGATVAILDGRDPDKGDRLTYTIVQDATGNETWNHPYFEINGNEVVVKTDLANALSSSPIYVKVTDVKGESFVKQVTLNVLDASERPDIAFDAVDVLEGSQGGIVVGTLQASSSVTYELSTVSALYFSLVENADHSYSVVANPELIVDLVNEDLQSFKVVVRYGDKTFVDVFNININENLEPEPNFQFNLVSGNAGAGTVVGTLEADDPEGKAVGFTLSADSAKLFRLVKNTNGTYSVVVKDGITLDRDNEDHHSFTVTVSDGFNTFEESFDVEFQSKAPTVTPTPRPVNEGAGGGTVVGTLTATDPEGDAISYTLTPASAQWFELSENEDGSCDIVVRDGVQVDFENPAHHSVTVLATDGENTVTTSVAIGIVDGIDILIGTQKNDALIGTAGHDIIRGLNGNDRLSAGTGDDTLYGGAGKDVLTGGDGRDIFVFDTKLNKKTNLDKITDFSVRDDSIWLENKIFTKLGKKGSETAPAQLSKKFFALEKAKDKDDYIVYSKKTGKLYYDADGSGSKAAVEIATLTKKLAMTNKDFFVI